jgi:hypothetical protein
MLRQSNKSLKLSRLLSCPGVLLYKRISGLFFKELK